MAFLVPKPIDRKTTKKPTSNQSSDNSSILDKIRKLCAFPKPIVEKLDERLFVSSLFDDIHELCRRPDLLDTIDDHLIEDTEQESDETVVETKVYQKKKPKYYCNSNETNSFDIISKSKLFATLVKGRPNQKADHLNNEINVEKQSERNTICENSVNNRKQSRKRSNVKSLESGPKLKRTRRPLLSIDCDITSKITEYSKQYSKANKKSNRKTVKKSNSINSSENSQGSTDSGICLSYESVSSPSVSTYIAMTYSMPATPISSTDSLSSGTSCETSSSVLSQIRKALNPKLETYRQYIQKCVQKDVNHKKGKTKPKRGLHYTEKVLEWSDKICSGNTTPLHNIEYLETPPGSPQKTHFCNNSTDELNAMIDSLENIQTNDRFDARFDELLDDLFSDIT